MNEDAFTLLIMGYNGLNAIRFKLNYIKHFNQMKEQLNCIQHLQKYDSVLVDIVPEMNVRKTMLENHLKIYLDKLNEE